MKNDVNETVTKQCKEGDFHFVSDCNILGKHLCKDDIHLTDVETNIFDSGVYQECFT